MTINAAFTHQKPMAISSITNVMSNAPSVTNLYPSHPQGFSHNYHHPQNRGHSPENFSSNIGHANSYSPRIGHNQHAFSSSSSPESNDSELPTFLPRKRKGEMVSTGSSGDENMQSCMNDILVPGLLSSSSDSSSSSSPSPSNCNSTLSLQERRQRNKTASAKYRAKKNQQHHEMRSVINTLTKENDVLLRQLEQVKDENRQLKSACDKLRSKMMAEKMLKKMLQQQQPQEKTDIQPPPSLVRVPMDDSESDSIYNESSDENYISNDYDSKHV